MVRDLEIIGLEDKIKSGYRTAKQKAEQSKLKRKTK
jgi:hypothetical protein